MTHNRAFGFRPDRANAAYLSHVMLMGDAPLLASSDLTAIMGAPIMQKILGECVGASFRMCLRLWFRIRGIEQPDISDFLAYLLAMANEYEGLDPDVRPALTDQGCIPETLLAAARDVGISLADDVPGPGDPGFNWTSIWQDPIRKTLRDPTPDQLVRAYDARGLDFFSVAYVPGTLRTECDRTIRRGFPIKLAINANGINDDDPRGEVVDDLPATSQNHMVAPVDASNPDWCRLANWWLEPDVPWGDPDPRYRGTWRCTWAALEKGATNILAVRGAPLVRKAAA